MKSSRPSSVFSLLAPYRLEIGLLLLLAFLSNGLNLWIPQISAKAIDSFVKGNFDTQTIFWELGIASAIIFFLVLLQGILQTYTSEKVARDLRAQVAEKIGRQSYVFIQNVSPGKLLTNLTADTDAIKMFVAMAIVAIASSVIIIIGAAALLLFTNFALGLAVLTVVPLIGATFFLIFKKVRVLFVRTREVLDWLNKVINESILGAALIRILGGQHLEEGKFLKANEEARQVGMKVLGLFAMMIPTITFISNLATIILITFGGWLVMNSSMTIGQLSAFNSYVMLFIFPIISLGFMSNFIAQANVSYGRIKEVLDAEDPKEEGTRAVPLKGEVAMDSVELLFEEKHTLKNISFTAHPGSKTAIIGPTAAGKTQLLQILSGLILPTHGRVTYDGFPIEEYTRESLYSQIAFVFQDSIIFNMSLRENIAFNGAMGEQDIQKAIRAAELQDFIQALPEGLDTVVSERGSDLSGGQKQRIMLARALAMNPRILLLDDFTSRVDARTEEAILTNITRLYPDLTLISVTQKISAIENYEQIIVLMEGEILGMGTHTHLMETCPEYVQIYNSQRSTNHYELHT